MDNTNSQKIYKTTLQQRNASYRYAFFNREKCNEFTVIYVPGDRRSFEIRLRPISVRQSK